jgi:rhodanese-related sulfurtransferase
MMEEQNMATMILGDNEIIDCAAALVLEGHEVFRLRDRKKDGQLVVDFDLRAPDETRIAKVSKNYAAYVAKGFRHRSGINWSEVMERASGLIVARVDAPSLDAVRVVGLFCVNGYCVAISENGLIADGVTISRNTIKGFGKAIALKRGFAIGLA